MKSHALFGVVALVFLFGAGPLRAQSLEQDLLREGPAALARAARNEGDAQRGAIVFFQPYMACTRCHAVGGREKSLGPDLARLDKSTADDELVDSVLEPSKVIRKGYEPVTVLTVNGRSLTGLLADETPQTLVLRDPTQDGQVVTLKKSDIDERSPGKLSIMPAGQVNQLASRQQFLDLVQYLIEIRNGGPRRAKQLEPPPSLFVLQIPEYEQHLDHAGMLATLDGECFRRGEAIYQRLCVNCHGTHDRPGSLPTSLKFASGRFKNGSDPHSIYQTLTRGFGQMAPQTWMVPQQKYDVIHYIREAYLKDSNPTQYTAIDAAYLERLPKGDSRGPAPTTVEPWVVMNYGPSLIHTYEVPPPAVGGGGGTLPAPNIACKGIAVRLDDGPGGVSRGHFWAVFEHDTLRLAGMWTGSGFVDWNGVQFNGRHEIHPHTIGQTLLSNPLGPGWADPVTGTFDDPRPRARDGRPYGPLPRQWGHFKGLYHHGDRVIFSYTIGDTELLEMPGVDVPAAAIPESGRDPNATPVHERPPAFTRTFQIGPRQRDLVLQVARLPEGGRLSTALAANDGKKWRWAAVSAGEHVLQADLSPLPVEPQWSLDKAGNLRLRLPAGDDELRFTLFISRRAAEKQRADSRSTFPLEDPPIDLRTLTHGGPPRWPERLTTTVELGKSDGPFAADVLTLPVDNPWLCQLRLTGLDFFPEGDRMAVCTWDGDVWLVSGLAGLDRPAQSSSAPAPSGPQLTWQRIASGLFQPLGLRIVGGKIHLTCRDQLVILHDLNGDGETDYYENFNSDHQVTEHFHEFAMGLQTDAAGNFYYAKSARHALPALVPHHGTLLRVSRDGSRTEILATGFRAANGVCLNPDGTFIVTDQEGHWNPKNRINWVNVGGFYGNMFGYHNVTDASDSAMQQPLCWITNAFDRSPAELLWVDSDHWGPLKGALLNLSYGYGKIYVVPHEVINDRHQGGMSAVPLANFPTGIMRGRFHPRDGQLYTCGMFAWAGSVTRPGGLYRVRYTGRAVHVPLELHARRGRVEIRFSGPIDPKSVENLENFAVKTWSLKRTANYGSDHYNETPLAVGGASLSKDGQTVTLELPELAPTWCMEIRYTLAARDGAPIDGVIHNTVHELGE